MNARHLPGRSRYWAAARRLVRVRSHSKADWSNITGRWIRSFGHIAATYDVDYEKLLVAERSAPIDSRPLFR